MKVQYAKLAKRQLKKLPQDLCIRIAQKLIWFGQQENPLSFAEPLQIPDEKLYRFRIGDYRAVFKIEKGIISILLVLMIQHRKDVYRRI